MGNVRTRVSAALAVVAMVIGGLAWTQGSASAAPVPVTYTCTGASNDTAGTEFVFFQGNVPRSSSYLLNVLAASISGFQAQPQISGTVNPNVPATFVVGQPTAVSFDFTAVLPTDLVTNAGALGLSQVTASNGTFRVIASGGTPSSLTSTLAGPVVVPLVAGASVSQTVSGSVVGNGNAILYRPGNVDISITLNVQVLALNIQTLTLNCTPSFTTLANPQASTATTTGSTTTTTTPTTTTTTAPTTTTTSTTTTSTTTTTAPPTTTTTTIPVPAGSVGYTVSGGYSSSAPLSPSTAGSIAVSTDQFGFAGAQGSATINTTTGPATVGVSVSRFLFWTFGSLRVFNPGAGINLTGFRLFGPAPVAVGGVYTLDSNWFTFENFQFKSFSLVVRFTSS